METRRTFLKAASFSIAGCVVAPAFGFAASVANSPFKIAVINDEISPDFDHACSVAARDFGMKWIELRSMWHKNVMDLNDQEIAEAKKILSKYGLQVTDIGSPLFKTDWPGAPRSKFSSKGDMHGAREEEFKRQDQILEHSIALAKQFGTNKVRCFDFWRIEDVKPYRAAIDEKLRKAAETAGKQGLLLVLENEFECNTATGREAARTLSAVKDPHLALNWDPGNAVMAKEFDAFPVAWKMLPKERIHHCHCKNAVKDASGKVSWAPVGKGIIDWTAQFRALKQVGYRGAVSLETHWRGAGTPEASTRISWDGMKKDLQDAGTLSS